MTEVYVSTDVEADGPLPGRNSMLSFGSAAYTLDDGLIGVFSANLELLDGATQDPSTMKWWQSQPDAWEVCRQNTRPASHVMNDYVVWLKALPGKPVFVGYPAGFDFTFIYWYLINFAGESPFSFSALDIKTYVMGMFNSQRVRKELFGFREINKKLMPKEWFGKQRHTHVAIDDAIEQGELFMNILKSQAND